MRDLQVSHAAATAAHTYIDANTGVENLALEQWRIQDFASPKALVGGQPRNIAPHISASIYFMSRWMLHEGDMLTTWVSRGR